MTREVTTWRYGGRMIMVGLFILWLCAPQSATQGMVVTVESSKCYSKSDCSLHLMECPLGHRMAITEAAYYFHTEARFSQCAEAVDAVFPNCMDDCCRNNGSDCSQTMSADNLERIRSSCSYQTTCSTRAQWTGNVDCGAGFGDSSTYDVLRADCVSDDVIVDPCTDVTVNGNLLSVIYAINTVNNNGNDCICRLDTSSGNDTNNSQTILVIAYDISANAGSDWSMTITRAGMEHAPTLYQLQGFQNFFPAAKLYTNTSPLTLTFSNQREGSRPQRAWLGLQVDGVTDPVTTKMTLRCGRDVISYELYLASLSATTTTTTSSTTSTTTTSTVTTTTPTTTATTSTTTTTTPTTTSTTPTTTTTTPSTTTTITTTTTTPTTSVSSTSTTTPAITTTTPQTTTPTTTSTTPTTTSTTPTTITTTPTTTTTITTSTTTPTTSVSSTSTTTPATTTTTPQTTTTTPTTSVSTTATSTASTTLTTAQTTTEPRETSSESTSLLSTWVTPLMSSVVSSTASKTETTTATTAVRTLATTTEALTAATPSTTSTTVPVPTTNTTVVVVVTSSKSSEKSTTPAPHISDTTAAPGSAAQKFADEVSEGLPVGGIVGIVVAAVVLSVVVVSLALRFRRNCYDDVRVKVLPDSPSPSIRGLNWRQLRSEQRSLKLYSPGGGSNNWASQPQEMEVVITPISGNKDDTSVVPDTDSARRNSKGDYNPRSDAVDHETGNKGDNTKDGGDVAGPKRSNGYTPFVSHVTVGRIPPPGGASDETTSSRHNGPQHSHPGNEHEAGVTGQVATTNIYSNVNDGSDVTDTQMNSDTNIYSNVNDGSDVTDTQMNSDTNIYSNVNDGSDVTDTQMNSDTNIYSNVNDGSDVTDTQMNSDTNIYSNVNDGSDVTDTQVNSDTNIYSNVNDGSDCSDSQVNSDTAVTKL